jgi:DNA-binding HxlR family transcriptional regulator
MSDHTATACPPPASDIAGLNAQVREAFAVFGGKWKLEILWVLSQRMHRFNELRRAIPGVTQHMLTAQLRELEQDGLVERTIHPEVPPRVEYRITAEALRLEPVFSAIFAWMRDRPSRIAADGGN